VHAIWKAGGSRKLTHKYVAFVENEITISPLFRNVFICYV